MNLGSLEENIVGEFQTSVAHHTCIGTTPHVYVSSWIVSSLKHHRFLNSRTNVPIPLVVAAIHLFFSRPLCVSGIDRVSASTNRNIIYSPPCPCS